MELPCRTRTAAGLETIALGIDRRIQASGLSPSDRAVAASATLAELLAVVAHGSIRQHAASTRPRNRSQRVLWLPAHPTTPYRYQHEPKFTSSPESTQQLESASELAFDFGWGKWFAFQKWLEASNQIRRVSKRGCLVRENDAALDQALIGGDVGQYLGAS